jgi:T5SS/PEP-CTERM-associated repeat protein
MCLELAASVGLVASLLFSSANPVRGDDYLRNLPGDFSNTDWTNISMEPPESPAGPPGAGDNASLNGRAVTANSGSVMTLNGGGSLTVSGGFNAQSASGFTLQGPGTLTANSSSGVNVDGGHLSAQTDVGKFINISNGGSEVAASLLAGTTGTVVSGGSLVATSAVNNLNLSFQSGGTGRMPNITNGRGTGGLTIDGGGSALTVDKNFSVMADQLDLSNGGHLTVNGQFLLDGVMENGQPIGGGAHWHGSSTTIDGTGNFILGQDGVGSVEIDDHASFSPDSLVLGQNANGSGGVTLTGSAGDNDAKVGVSKGLTVGDGGIALLTVRNGAKFTALGPVIVGKQTNSRPKSQITLTGTASTFQVNGSSDFVVGQDGKGDFAVSDHATFTAPSVVLGQNANSNGNLSVTGSGGTNDAIVTVTKSLTVGDKGTGSVGVYNGGKLATQFVSLGAKGSIAVDGAASNLTMASFFDSSPGGPSTSTSRFAVTGGGIITCSGNSIFEIVDTSGAPPALVVRGSGSQFNANTGHIDIGSVEGAGTADISSGGTVTANSVAISDPFRQSKVTVGGNATLVSTVSVKDQLQVDSGGTLDIGAGGNVTADTNIFIFNGSHVNVHDAGAILDAPTIRVAGAGTALTVSKGGISFSGGPGGELVIDEGGNATVSDAGSNLRSATIKVGGTATGNLMTQSDGHIESILSVSVAQSSTLSTAAGGSVDIGPTLFTKAASGEIRIGPGGRLNDNGFVTGNVTIQFGGWVTGSGTINGELIDSGRVGSGNSPGILTVQDDYTQNSDGLMSVEIGGTDPGSGYDQLQVSGTATIDGQLDVRLVNGFTPTVGQTFRIVTGSFFSGAFSSITQPSQAGISVSNDAGGVTVTITSVVAGAPVISSPTTVAATQGEAFSYQIAATNNPTSFGAMNLQDGLTVDHASGLISGTPAKAGNYIVPMAANNNAGSGQADLIIGVGLPTVTKPSQLLNISTRMRVLAGDNVLIGGFIVTGTEPKKVVIRGIGPSLSVNGAPIPGRLADPTLELHQPDGTVITNDNWKINAQTGQSQEADIRATTIPPTDDLESALIATLRPGNYSAVLGGKNQSSGIGVVEVYDLEQTADSQLANISSRGFIDTGDNAMIGGFIVGGGTGNANVIVRALGPSVPVTGALGDPTLELHDASGTTVISNDDWKTRPDGSSQQVEIEATTIPPRNDLESAVVASLPPGNYTAVVRGKNNITGVGLVEVYDLQ